MHVEDKKQDY